MTFEHSTLAPAQGEAPSKRPIPSIPFEMAVLPNGLILIVHEDHRRPLVCTQLRFNVGSKDEPPGRTGFAHLFEHLMFKESAHRTGNWHTMIQAMGGLGVNGTTNLDRTNFFQTVPTAALDRLLWMESDRMGHLLAGLDPETLAAEIAVVKNEKRQRESAPYGGVFEAITTALYPKEHPYGHTVLGSFDDLDNATLETVADWHSRWYGASNAVLVLAGDISFADALAKVEHWFGAIPPGIPVRRSTQWLPDVRDTKRVTLFDRVPLRQTHAIWSTPNAAHPDSTVLQLIAAILTGGVQSRLVRRLVDGDRTCIGIAAVQDERYLCSEFQVTATLAPDADPAIVEAAIDEEIVRFATEGPREDELERVRRSLRFNALRALDGVGQINDILASSMILHGRPDGYAALLQIADEASADHVRDVASRWLSKKALVVEVEPFEAAAAAADLADRSVAPALGEFHASPFPKVERARLGNGLNICLARQSGTNEANLLLHMEGGSALDPEVLEGLTRIALSTMDASTSGRSKLQLAEAFSEHGVGYGVGVAADHVTLSMSALKDELRVAVPLLAEILTDPVYPDDEIQQFLNRQIVEVSGRGQSPAAAAAMASSRLIFGRGHMLARSPSGTAQSLAAIGRDRIVARHRAWQDPARATLIVVGDVAIDEIVDLAEASFGNWKATAAMIEQPASVWAPQRGRYLIDRPGAAQSTLQIALASPEFKIGNEALGIFNLLFGGSFGSRINANLRERRGWTYGAGSGFVLTPTMGSFTIGTSVQADRSLDAVTEIENELIALSSERPPTTEEIEEARHAILARLPSRWAGNGPVLNGLLERLIFNLSDDFHDEIEQRVRSVGTAEISEVVSLVCDPASYSWVVAGDRAQLGDSDLIRIDEYAQPIRI